MSTAEHLVRPMADKSVTPAMLVEVPRHTSVGFLM
jgi:hypothetical protein